MKKTLVIGSSVCDVIIRLPHIPHPQEDINIIKQTLSIGGCAYNVSQMLRYYDVPYTLFSPVGTGIYGDFVKKHFKENNIPIILESSYQNGCCYCLVDDSKDRTFICEHGAEYIFEKEWFDSLQCDDYHQVYICGLEIEEKSGDVIIDFLMNHPHFKIYFAPGPRITHINKKRMDRLLTLHPVLHLNQQEIISYTKEKDIHKAARKIYEITQEIIIITLGQEGCYCFDGKKDILIPAIKTEVVDTIGAGDGHIGAFIANQALSFSIYDSLLKANKMAAEIVNHQGATLNNIIHHISK